MPAVLLLVFSVCCLLGSSLGGFRHELLTVVLKSDGEETCKPGGHQEYA